MNKLLTTLSCVAIFATIASADWGRFELGGGLWEQTPSGYRSYTETLGLFSSDGRYTSNEKSSSDVYVWALLKHPIPIIPNIRVEYATASDEGQVTGSFEDFVSPGLADASIDITEYDIIPYYNLLDNTFWMTIDLGIDIKIIEADYTAEGVDVGSTIDTSYSSSESIVMPLLYLRGRVEIPATNIGIEADGKYVTYGGSTVYDIRAKVDYTLGFVPVVQPALEVGYRIQKIDYTSDDEKSRMNLDFSGVYVGLMLRF